MSVDFLKSLPQYLAPQHFLSRLAGKMANCRWGWLKRLLINYCIRQYQVDLSDAEQTDPNAYESFNDFFTRALQPATRPIANEPRVIISPVDGVVSQLGQADNDQLLQAKGRVYSLVHLLGGQVEHALPFQKGHFITLYLAPKDYHRVHMPVTGTLQEMIYIPGQLFSVNHRTTRAVSNLFVRNERVVSIFDGAEGAFAVVMVGAMLVGSMQTVWHGDVTPQKKRQITRWDHREQAITLQQGAELGRFKFGSTVILVFPPDSAHWAASLQSDDVVKMGQRIGTFNE